MDCEYSAYGEWSDCSKSCGGGFRTRERHIKMLARRGGKPCRGPARETQFCNRQRCPRKDRQTASERTRLVRPVSVDRRYERTSLVPALNQSISQSSRCSVLSTPATNQPPRSLDPLCVERTRDPRPHRIYLDLPSREPLHPEPDTPYFPSSSVPKLRDNT